MPGNNDTPPGNQVNADDNTGADNTATVNNNRCSNKQLLAKFAGHKTVIRADIWCNLYEVVTNGQTDQQRLFGLMAYLIDDALNWFGTDIAPKLTEYSWSTVREMLIARFGPAIANPLVEAQRRHLKPTETVQNYYDDKMRCLRHVSLKEKDMVAQLTEGMPISYKGLLLCSKPPTTVSWLAIALQLEATVKRQPFTVTKPKPPFQNKQQFRPVAMIASTTTETQNNPRRDYRRNQNSNPPTTPCRFCQEAGETIYHWHNQCPRRQRTNNQTYAKTPAVQQTEEAMISDSNETTLCVQGNFPGGRL